MKKRIVMLLLCGCMTFSLFGCAKEDTNKKDESQQEENTENTDEEDLIDDDMGVLYVPDITQEALNAERDADNAIDLLTCPWDHVAFRLQEETYDLPFSYARISESWTFQLTDYGYDENFRLQPGERTTATVELTNPNFDYSMTVGFYNPYDVPITVEESMVWSVSFDFTETKSEIFPLLPGNITKSSPIVDVIILYDTPETPFSYNEETGTYDLYYQFGKDRFEYGYDKYVTLFIDAEDGLAKFIIQNYAE